MYRNLNLGCGNDYRPGFINADSGNCKKDIHLEIEETPYNLEDNSFDYVLMQHVLEHISKESFVGVMREIHRICAPNAIIYIISPHAGSNNFYTDFTHKLPLTVRTFDFFDPSKPLFENGKIYGINFSFEVILAEKVENQPNGPDVMFKLKVLK